MKIDQQNNLKRKKDEINYSILFFLMFLALEEHSALKCETVKHVRSIKLTRR